MACNNVAPNYNIYSMEIFFHIIFFSSSFRNRLCAVYRRWFCIMSGENVWVCVYYFFAFHSWILSMDLVINNKGKWLTLHTALVMTILYGRQHYTHTQTHCNDIGCWLLFEFHIKMLYFIPPTRQPTNRPTDGFGCSKEKLKSAINKWKLLSLLLHAKINAKG